MLGGSKFRLRRDFAAQNARDAGLPAVRIPKELWGRLTNALVSGTMSARNGGFAVVPYLYRDYCNAITFFMTFFPLRCTLPIQVSSTGQNANKRNSMRVSLFLMHTGSRALHYNNRKDNNRKASPHRIGHRNAFFLAQSSRSRMTSGL